MWVFKVRLAPTQVCTKAKRRPYLWRSMLMATLGLFFLSFSQGGGDYEQLQIPVNSETKRHLIES